MGKLTSEQKQQREEFLLWVEREMEMRRINNDILADVGGVSPSLVSMTLGRQLRTLYGPKFVRAVAITFNLSEAYVFEKAGLIEGPAEEMTATGIIAEAARGLTIEDKQKTLEYIQFLKLKRQEQDEKKNDLAGRVNRLSNSGQRQVLNAGLAVAAVRQPQDQRQPTGRPLPTPPDF